MHRFLWNFKVFVYKLMKLELVLEKIMNTDKSLSCVIRLHLQACLVLRDLFLRDFTLIQLENLYHFLN
jgi:hypothetical protein